MTEYRPCPKCGGEIEYLYVEEYDENDELIDIFHCIDCDKIFEDWNASDNLYLYFTNFIDEI